MVKANGISLSMVATAIILNPLHADSVNLGDISVTATKTSIKTSEAPASTEIISSEQIENKQIERVDEALNDVAGVFVRSKGDHLPSSWANTVSLRGISGYSRTAVLVDGVSINNAFSSGVNWSSVPIDDIEKVEVVKGPFSSLYGGSAMSGVINIIRKEPTKQEFIIKSGYGSNDYKNAEFSYKDKLSDKLGISINYGHKESNGYISDLVLKTPSTGVSGTAVSGQKVTTTSTGSQKYIVGDKGDRSWEQDNAGIKLFYSLSNTAKISVDYNHHEYETEYNSFNTYLHDTSGNPVYTGSVQLDATQETTLSEKDFLFGPNGEESDKLTLNYKDTFNDTIDLDMKASYGAYNYWYVSQKSGAYTFGGPGTYTDIPNKKIYASAQLNFPLGDYNYITMGIDITDSELEKDIYTLANWNDYNSKTSLQRENNGESALKAFFIQNTIDITDKLIAYIGGRYDYWETKGQFNDYINDAYITYNKRDDSAFSPKVSLVYLPKKGTTIRTSWGKAFRAPSLSDMYSSYYSGAKLVQASPTLKPETVTSWELGFEQKFTTATHIKATYYENILKDMMYSTDVNSTLNEKRNAGKAEIKGFEIEIKQAITDNISTFANYTYNKTKMLENDSRPTSVGKQLTYTPKRQYNIGLIGKNTLWNGSIIGSYVDSLYTKEDNSDTIKNVYGAYESYFVLNATLGYKIMEYLKASVSVNNIFDTDYYQNTLTPGRTIYGELRFKF
ncbi:TonB-dependent receptor [Sulfurimonas lithotrophica]|uniref:TonB-dependent receptor n=1 Tax=Sulfurimonas lithotrophica TaxID=2590022 RepID=A0A5P8NYY5_9BACT|nr:TonB-dependent receptor [Sulfurimonas lithotrophica]QFR48614.1 TonB-dependent receptor [Sulfurimonas lithotrophica]